METNEAKNVRTQTEKKQHTQNIQRLINIIMIELFVFY